MLDVSSDWKSMPKELKVSRVRKMVEVDGFSAREVVGVFSTTRRAVIGFCRRNQILFGKRIDCKLETKPKEKRPFTLYQFPTKRPVKPSLGNRVKPSPDERPVAFLEVKSGECRRPLWGKDRNLSIHEKFFCGAPTLEGQSFCPHCAAQLYEDRERADAS